jgi:hypothetical protein
MHSKSKYYYIHFYWLLLQDSVPTQRYVWNYNGSVTNREACYEPKVKIRTAGHNSVIKCEFSVRILSDSSYSLSAIPQLHFRLS